MLLQEIPALPFALEADEVAEWLDRLRLSNIRECCQRFFPVLQALNFYPMQPRLRFDILEQCHPVVDGVARGLVAYFVDMRFPLDDKARKIASLSWRFHLEAVAGYRQLVDAPTFAEVFALEERVLILRRALEHAVQGVVRAAQVHETPSSSLGASLRRLYQYAEASGLIDETAALERESAVSARGLFERALLFKLAAPCRLAPADMQRLFDLLAAPTPAPVGRGVDEGGARAVFCFNPEDTGLLVPASPLMPPVPGLRALSAEKYLPALRQALRATAQPELDPLIRVLPRLGDRLPCPDDAGGRRVALYAGINAIAAMLIDIEFRRDRPGRQSSWASLNELELTPLGSRETSSLPRFTDRTLMEAVVADESSESLRTVEIVPTELPGFYLFDTGRLLLRAGLLVGMNSDDAWIQVGVLRGGQIRDGRFWHGFELLGAKPQLVRVRCDRVKDGVRNALLLEATEPAAGASLIAEAVRWRSGDTLTVDGNAGKRVFRVAKLLEATAMFHQFALLDAAQAGV